MIDTERNFFSESSKAEHRDEDGGNSESFKSVKEGIGRDDSGGAVGASQVHVLSELESGDECASLSEESSACECEDLDQCPHARQYVLSVSVDPSTCSYHTDNSDASVSYFFEPPLHPRVFELKEENRLEQDCQVRRVSNAVFEPYGVSSYGVMGLDCATGDYEDNSDVADQGNNLEGNEHNLLEEVYSDNINDMRNERDQQANSSGFVTADRQEKTQ